MAAVLTISKIGFRFGAPFHRVRRGEGFPLFAVPLIDLRVNISDDFATKATASRAHRAQTCTHERESFVPIRDRKS